MSDALLAGRREQLQLPRLQQRKKRGLDGEYRVGFAGGDGESRLGRASIGHMGAGKTGSALEQLHCQMRGAAVAHRRIQKLAVLLLGPGNEFGDGVRRMGRGHGQHVGLQRGQDDRHQILGRVVGHSAIQKRCNRDRPIETHSESEAICRRLGYRAHAEHTAGARLALDHNRLLPPRVELLTQHPRHHIQRAAGGGWNDDVNGLARPALRLRCRRQHGNER